MSTLYLVSGDSSNSSVDEGGWSENDGHSSGTEEDPDVSIVDPETFSTDSSKGSASLARGTFEASPLRKRHHATTNVGVQPAGPSTAVPLLKNPWKDANQTSPSVDGMSLTVNKTPGATKSLFGPRDSSSDEEVELEHEIVFEKASGEETPVSSSSSSSSDSSLEEVSVSDGEEYVEEVLVEDGDVPVLNSEPMEETEIPKTNQPVKVGVLDQDDDEALEPVVEQDSKSNDPPRRKGFLGLFGKTIPATDTISYNNTAPKVVEYAEEAVNDVEEPSETLPIEIADTHRKGRFAWRTGKSKPDEQADGQQSEKGALENVDNLLVAETTESKQRRGLFGRRQRASSKDIEQANLEAAANIAPETICETQDEQPPNADFNGTSGPVPKATSDDEIVSMSNTEAEIMFGDGSTNGGTPSVRAHSTPTRQASDAESGEFFTPEHEHTHTRRPLFGVGRAKTPDTSPSEDEPSMEAPSLNNHTKDHHGSTLTPRRLYLILLLATVVIVLCSIGTAFYGTKLALEVFGTEKRGSVPSPAPVLIEDELCPVENVPIEFHITFDSKPAEVGITLRDAGSTTSGVWLFGPGTFRSFTQFARSNVFRLCVSPQLEYDFEVSDAASNGLVANFAGTNVFGHWELFYNNSLAASYNGNCNDTAVNECGEYCSCKYTLTSRRTTGVCETECPEV
ncbi:predicted protein [Phaeodactylum tricornutum CCAP 1055/1]|uniref:Uncharacterized protein n=1 Tax=Phaeodactylum tricornutum (strain CCAP 1055/1) TaxID=556484 RepID=B7G7P1_PHATC|nr:predicted protein [Phaeodactylum tricornutum CCAP 1055/1]EEC45268.1 predicted protein [Phaeodactylum tricornutum CCAP 1055/1]|eukprot:XP_002183050.1 predicted protein [Phaeodactylum tricornutum CCAP 1055/1]